MNRANFGNIVTNGMQILSVGATTAGHFIGAAHKVLNNKENEQQPEIEQKQQADLTYQKERRERKMLEKEEMLKEAQKEIALSGIGKTSNASGLTRPNEYM